MNTTRIQSHKLYKQTIKELKESWPYNDSRVEIYKSILGNNNNYYFLGVKNTIGTTFT